jgi:hypothetical protein
VQFKVIRVSDGLGEILRITDSEHAADRNRRRARILDDNLHGAVSIDLRDGVTEGSVVERDLPTLPGGNGVE